MSEFIAIFGEVLGVISWFLISIGLICRGLLWSEKTANRIILVASGVILVALGIAFQVYAMEHSLIKQ